MQNFISCHACITRFLLITEFACLACFSSPLFPNAFGIRPVAGVDDGGDGGINEGIEVTKDGRDEGWEEGVCEGGVGHSASVSARTVPLLTWRSSCLPVEQFK